MRSSEGQLVDVDAIVTDLTTFHEDGTGRFAEPLEQIFIRLCRGGEEPRAEVRIGSDSDILPSDPDWKMVASVTGTMQLGFDEVADVVERHA